MSPEGAGHWLSQGGACTGWEVEAGESGQGPWAVRQTRVHLHQIGGDQMSFLQVFVKLSQTWSFSASCLSQCELG